MDINLYLFKDLAYTPRFIGILRFMMQTSSALVKQIRHGYPNPDLGVK